MGALCLALALGGCAGAGADPVAWWHDLEGGPIADQRPPPPGADAPYPNLATVPARPAADTPAARAGVAARLATDRASADYGARLAPIAAPPPRPAPPPPDAQTASATMPAAAAPAAAPPARPAPAPTAAPAAGLPPIPGGPPAPPALPGVAQATRPTPPPVPPPAPPPAPPAIVDGTLAVAFPPGSAALPPEATAPLRALASRRGGRPIAVAGFGGAPEGDTAAQQAALPLAFARARAIAVVLAQAGVPDTALRLAAEATGRGGVARIAD